MNEGITAVTGLTIGLDVGDKQTVGCVLSASGEMLETFRMATTPGAVRRTLGGFERSRVVVAVARKLSVLLHRLWMTGEVYEPLGYGREQREAA